MRKLSGIAFPGAPYEHAFFVADTEATGPMVADELNVFLWRSGFHLYFPMRGTNRWRVIGILPNELSGRDDVTFEDLVPSLLQVGGTGLSFKACHWFSTYRIHHRCTERFRDRRCFLLGDAAHVHSPMGGQGMNTGLQDAYNLAWKLALVIANRASDALLDTYEAERRPFAQQLLATTDRAFRVVVSENWFAGMLRTHIVPRVAAIAMSRRWVQRAAFRALSQIGIRYRESALSQDLGEPAGNAPHAGDRFPWLRLKFKPQGPREDLFQRLDDTRFNLLVIGQPAPSREGLGLGDMLQVHAIPSDPENDARIRRRVDRRSLVLRLAPRRPHRAHRHGLPGGRPEAVARAAAPATREQPGAARGDSESNSRLTGRWKRCPGETDTLHRLHERHFDEVFGNEPDLQVVAADYAADDQVIRAIVAAFSRATCHRARFLQHDLMCMQQPRNLNRYFFASLRRSWNQRRLGHIVGHGYADTAE